MCVEYDEEFADKIKSAQENARRAAFRSASLMKQLEATEQKLEEAEQKLEEAEQKVHASLKKLESHEINLKETYNKLNESQRNLEATRQKLEITEQRLKSSDQQLASLRARCAKLEQLEEYQKSINSELNIQIEAFKNSTSWRITKPLRWLRSCAYNPS